MKSDPPEEKWRKKLQWVKWLAATVITIFIGGYVVGMQLSALAKTEDVDAAIEEFAEEHEADHTKLTQRIRRIRSEQRAQGARQRLLNTQVDLVLVSLEERPRTRAGVLNRQRRQRTLEREMTEQQVAVGEIENELEVEYPDDDSE